MSDKKTTEPIQPKVKLLVEVLNTEDKIKIMEEKRKKKEKEEKAKA